VQFKGIKAKLFSRKGELIYRQFELRESKENEESGENPEPIMSGSNVDSCSIPLRPIDTSQARGLQNVPHSQNESQDKLSLISDLCCAIQGK
jgi:hypothetical protein